jgi:16S rRNA (guanine966-N2)-methyltransferase
VLDAFAGSGAIGLEMLSRGALSCTFVERDRKASGVVRANVKALGATAARVQVGDVLQLAERGAVQGGPFALVLLDPPYALDAAVVSHLVESLRASGQLTDDAVVLYEHAADAPDLALAGCEVLKSKAKGTTAVTLLRLASQEGSES